MQHQATAYQAANRTGVDLKTLERELQQARRARIAAENAGGDLERLIEWIRLGFSLRQIELGIATPAPAH